MHGLLLDWEHGCYSMFMELKGDDSRQRIIVQGYGIT